MTFETVILGFVIPNEVRDLYISAAADPSLRSG
jgi:hypothetical protein